jgi:hypothetical protein
MKQIINFTMKMLGAKKPPPVSLMKSCPFGGGTVQCPNCKLVVLLKTEDEIQELRTKGEFEAAENSYTCIFVVIANKLMRKQ